MLMKNEDILNAIDELETNAIIVVDSEGFIRRINKGVTAILGYSEHDLIGNRLEMLLDSATRKLHRERFLRYTERRKMEVAHISDLIGAQRSFPDTIAVGSHEPIPFAVIHKSQFKIPISLTINEIWSDSDDLVGFVAIISDQTEQYNLQKKLQYQAAYDSLTGLMTLPEFERKVQDHKSRVLEKGQEYQASLLFLDIDYFRSITFGSLKSGDRALKMVATWLLEHTRQADDRARDIISLRFLGDQFLLYLPDTSLGGATELSRRLKKEFTKLNLRTAEEPFYTTISIGATIVTKDTKLHNAASQAAHACNLAKNRGRNKIEAVAEDSDEYLGLERIIREALQNRQLRLHAQKIVAISPSAKALDGDRTHYEVLSRMAGRNGKDLSPAVFIPAAEKLGLAIAIDRFVIEHAVALLRSNPGHVDALSLCSINLSGVSVSCEEMFSFIEAQIRQSGIDPGKFCFEVTETTEIMDRNIALSLVTNLKALGCKTAFDDFGIGYSNYQSFSRLPMDIIKIDGSYVRRVLDDHRLRTDMEGMINSAKARGIEVVGEFAENADIVAQLERIGVDYAQGYYFSKPIPLEELIAETTR